MSAAETGNPHAEQKAKHLYFCVHSPLTVENLLNNMDTQATNRGGKFLVAKGGNYANGAFGPPWMRKHSRRGYLAASF